jgi:hypothetical protein
MDWVPTDAWLSKVRIDAAAPELAFDLAIDASGAGQPSRVAAGLDLPGTVLAADRSADLPRIAIALAFTFGGIGGILLLLVYRPPMRST